MKGWYNQSYRHSLAAKGVKTCKNKRHRYEAIETKKGDLLEPFRDPSEKSNMGADMASAIVNRKTMEAEQMMNVRGVSFEDKQRIMDHYVAPLAERFKSGGMTEAEFDREVDQKIKVNSKVHSKNLGIFDWGDDESQDKDGTGALNFMDKAQKSSFAAKEESEEAYVMMKDGEAVGIAVDPEKAKSRLEMQYPNSEITSEYAGHVKRTRLAAKYPKQETVENLSPSEKVLGWGIITQHKNIEYMKRRDY